MILVFWFFGFLVFLFFVCLFALNINMAERNSIQFNAKSGNGTCDMLNVQMLIRDKGDLEVWGKSTLGSVVTKSISHKNGTSINGITLKDGTMTADKLVVGGDTVAATEVTLLSNTDFEDGTYRIQTAGHYRLVEDIVFNPNPNSVRADRPTGVDWFAALSIECENFDLDGCGFSISASQDFVDAHIQKVYSNIELGNAPLPGVPFPLNTVAFTGETEIKRARRGRIHNIKLGLSSHHGIHGNGNTEIIIEDFQISDHEVTGITLNSPYNIIIRNGSIGGNSHEIFNRSRPGQLKTLLESLRLYSDKSGASTYITAVNAALTAELASRSQDPISVPDGNTYGISFAPPPAAAGPRFDQAACDSAPDLGYQRLPSNILVENVRINDIRGAPIQQVCLVGDIAVGPYTGAPGAPQPQQIVTNHAGAFGALQWHDFYTDGTGAWNVTTIAKAQTWLLKQRRIELAIDEADSYFLPTGFEANILQTTPVEATFRTHVKPGFDFDIAHANKGVFGIKMGCCSNVTIKDCSISRVHNTAAASLLRSDIADGASYNDAQAGLDKRMVGVDAFGISMENCKNCKVVDSSISEVQSDNGYTYGIVFFGDSVYNSVEGGSVGEVTSFADPASPDVPNPVGHSYGIAAESSDLNQVSGTQVVNVSSPRCAYAMSAVAGRTNKYSACPVSGVYATAAHDAARPKTAYGGYTSGGSRTHFHECSVLDVAIQGEDSEVALSTSEATGFRINDDRNTLQSCQVLQTDAGAGATHGIRLEGDNNITKGKVVLGTLASNANGTESDYTDNGTANLDVV